MPDHPLTHAIVQPWQTAATSPTLTAAHGRPCLLLPGDVHRVILESTDQPLPLAGGFTDERRFDWNCFELPASHADARDPPADETIHLRLFNAQQTPQSLDVQLTGGLAPPRTANTTPPDWRFAAQAAQHLVTDHVERMAVLNETWRRDEQACWDDARDAAVWPLKAVLNVWCGQTPVRSLLEALAPRLIQALRCLEKENLARTTIEASRTTFTPLGADNTTLKRWPCDATSHHDTIDRETLTRLENLCAEQPHTHERMPEHDEPAPLTTLRRLVRRLIYSADVIRHRPAQTMNRASDTLAPDRRRLHLRRLMHRLATHTQALADAWPWRHRVWSEACYLLLLAAMDRVQPQSTAARSRLAIQTHPDAGRLISPCSAPGRWDIPLHDHAATVYLVPADRLEAYSALCPLPHELLAMRPDWLFLRFDLFKPDQPPSAMLAGWTLLDFDLDEDRLTTRCDEVNTRLKQIRTHGPLTAWIMQPNVAPSPERDDSTDPPSPQENHFEITPRDRCSAIRLSIPPQQHIETLAESLRRWML